MLPCDLIEIVQLVGFFYRDDLSTIFLLPLDRKRYAAHWDLRYELVGIAEFASRIRVDKIIQDIEDEALDNDIRRWTEED